MGDKAFDCWRALGRSGCPIHSAGWPCVTCGCSWGQTGFSGAAL